MRVVLQRVKSASVRIDGKNKRSINEGLCILVGIEHEDSEEDSNWLVNKISKLRIFPDEDDVMNKSILDINGDLLVISQFTLHASTKKGNRPSYIKAARPEVAIPLYSSFLQKLASLDLTIKAGEFGADMMVEIWNDGPVTILIDSKNRE